MDLAAEPTQPAQSSPGRFAAVRRWWSASAGFGWPEGAALSLFAALVAFAIPFHEPWSDEAQAWQLARTLSLGDLFRTYIRYEASPGLWHFLLWVLIRLHVTYTGIHWICGAVAVAAAALLVLKSPFPRYLRLTLPFTYFLLFQYAVIARNYVLAPPLIFLLAMTWEGSPWVVAILLGLTANLSLHSALIAGGLAIAYLVRRPWRASTNVGSREVMPPLMALIALSLFALWTAWPPPDLAAHVHSQLSGPFLLSVLGSVTLGTCEPWYVSVLFWIAIVLCLHARRALLFLLPIALFAVFSGAVTSQFWHMGLLVPLVIAILWITWPKHNESFNRFEIAMRIALLVMAFTQIGWSVHAIAWDYGHAFSGDLAASRFLAPFVGDHARIDATSVGEPDARAFDAVGIQPYFDRNIYENAPKPFWWWSEENPIEDRFNDLLPTHPQIVVVEARLRSPDGAFDMQDPGFQRLIRAGYRFTNQFCGTVPMRFEFGLTSCHLIFQRADSWGNLSSPASNRR